MGNRRNRQTRRRIIKNSKVFKTIVTILLIAIVFLFIQLIINKIKVYNEKKIIMKASNEVNTNILTSFETANNEINNTENYKTNTIIRFAILGDVYSDEKMISYINKNDDLDYMVNDVEQYFTNTDFTISSDFINSLNEENESFNEKIKKIGINSFDYTNNEENDIKIIEKKGAKISIIECSQEDFNEEDINNKLKYANENTNFSIVLIKWEDTKSTSITEDEENIVNSLISNGANIIIGTNSTCLKQMEIKKNDNGKDCFVIYSLGSFLTSSATEKNKNGLILNLQVLIDTEGKSSLNKVNYNRCYMNDYGSNEKERYKILDIKNEIDKYEDKLDEEKNEVNKNTNTTNESIVDKRTYNKLKNSMNFIEDIVN